MKSTTSGMQFRKGKGQTTLKAEAFYRTRPSLSMVAGYGISAWALLFALPHVYWALGGREGMVATVGTDSVAELGGTWFIAIGLWGTSLLCIAAALFGLAIAQPWGRALPRWLLLVDALGACGLFLLRAGLGFVQFGLIQVGVVSIPNDPALWLVVHSDLLLWCPFFLVGSALFGMAAWSLRSKSRRFER